MKVKKGEQRKKKIEGSKKSAVCAFSGTRLYYYCVVLRFKEVDDLTGFTNLLGRRQTGATVFFESLAGFLDLDLGSKSR